MTGALIYSDDVSVSLELVGLASKLGKVASVVSIVPGDAADIVKKLSVEGVTQIFVASNVAFKDLLADTIVEVLSGVYPKANPDLVLIGATKRGKDAAPMLAARLKLGCISDSIKVEFRGRDLVCQRLVWGGNSIATVSSNGPAVVTVPPRAHERASGTSSPSVVSVDSAPKKRVSVVGRKEKQKGQVSLKDAEVIVSAGRGFKKREDLALLDDLTKVLNGVLGASRPLTSDLGWVPEERQVGLTGTTVKPKLYIAVGISGQIQHLTGMRDSKLIVAVNSDKNAPIFQECDYGVVGDLYAIVPKLVSALKEKLA